MIGTDMLPEHTFGQRINGKDECPRCPGPHGGPGPCDLSIDSKFRRRFDMVPLHLEELLTAYLSLDHSAIATVRERQRQERENLPPGHLCTCVCRNVQHGRAMCAECVRIRKNEVPQVIIEIGRTAAVNAAMPDAATLDLLLGKL